MSITDLSGADAVEPAVPQWLLDIEAADFRTAHDTGAQVNALLVWNRVRAAHGLPELTEDALWQRHADTVGWSAEELVRERENWNEFAKWEGLRAIRDAYREHEAELADLPDTNEEFFARLRERQSAE